MSIKKKIVLKIGGSVMYDENLDINFSLLHKVKNWYERVKSEYSKIIFVVGGGKLSRQLQKKMGDSIKDQHSLHSVAMSVTQTNASLLSAVLADRSIFVPQKLGDAYEFLIDENTHTLVSGGLKVGWSTDMDASIFADIISTDRVIKISDIDYLYDNDPHEFPDAQVIKEISWGEYFKLFDITEESQHQPNKSVPVDKECALFSSKKMISFFICGGKNLFQKENIEDIISEGTLVYP